MKLYLVRQDPDEHDSAAVVHATQYGVTITILEGQKARAGVAFRPEHARKFAERMLKCADAYDAEMVKKAGDS